MDIFSNPTAYAAPIIDEENDQDPLADLGRDSYAQAAGDEQTATYEDGFFYEAPEVIEQTQKIQKESGAYGLYYDVDKTTQGNYYEPAAGNSYTYGAHSDDDDSTSLSEEVKDFRNKIQKPLSTAIQDFAKSYYWNERFQALLERPTFTPKEIALRQADIDHFVQEFVLVAKPVCEQIVKEISLPVEKKQVKPIAAGGIAGGEKYLHKDLFLKFARDHIQIQLYGGDEWAQKAAFHELKSLSALISCGVPNLHFPMMCLVKCYGHCLVVVSKLPLSGNTLIYGSANAAVDIKTDNYDMETMLKQVVQTLNLKPHQVLETRTKILKTLYGPVDIEGHQGLDGRYYVVDTARLFPPATPIAKVKGCHLYKLLRPELVKANPVPLSSDAFSTFGRPNQKEHNDEVREATRRVLADIIPNKLARNKGFLVRSIKDELHSYGVNMRYLGSVYAHSRDRTHANYDRDVHLVLLIELVARAFKGVLFGEWRKIESDIPSRSKVVAVKYFNLLLGQGPNVNNFWMSSLKEAIVKRFIFYPETESTDDYEKHVQYALSVLEPNMHNTICQSQGCRVKLFERAIALTGVEFSKAVMTDIGRIFDTFFNSPQPFKQGDVTNIQLLAKYIEVKPFIDVLRANFKEAEKFYLDELKSRREILGDDHMQLALTHINLGDLYSDKNKKEQAEEQYNLALRIMKTVDAEQTDVADLREKRADFYLKFDMLDKAESELNTVINLKIKYLKEKGFSQDSLAVAALKDKLARVFTKQQRFQEAKTVLEEVIRIKQAKFDHFHWQVAKSLNNLAQVMFAQKEYNKAEPICQNVLDILVRQRGPEHSEVGIALDNLAKIYAATGRRERAQKLLEQAKDIKIKAFGDTHTYVGITLDHLASNLLATVTNNFPNKESVLEECKNYYEKALSIFKATYGELHAALGITNNNLGLLHLKLHKYDEALGYFEKAHQIFMDTVGPTSPQTVATMNNIQLIKQSSPDVLDTLTFEQAYHSGEMYADASEKVADESTQLDDATAALIRELGFDPSQFTKTQAAQILEMLNSLQTTETPTPEPEPEPEQPQGYSIIGESDDEYEVSGSGSDEDESSESGEGYVGYSQPTEPSEPTTVPTSERVEDPMPVQGTLSGVKPYAYEGTPPSDDIGGSAPGAMDRTAMVEEQLKQTYQERSLKRPPSLTKKKSSKFFDSFVDGVRNAFTFWKSKDKKADKQAKQAASPRPTDTAQQSIIAVSDNVAERVQGYGYADENASNTNEDQKNIGAYSPYSAAYNENEELYVDEDEPAEVNKQLQSPIDASSPYSLAEYDAVESVNNNNNNAAVQTNVQPSSGYLAYARAADDDDIPSSPSLQVQLPPMLAPITKPIEINADESLALSELEKKEEQLSEPTVQLRASSPRGPVTSSIPTTQAAQNMPPPPPPSEAQMPPQPPPGAHMPPPRPMAPLSPPLPSLDMLASNSAALSRTSTSTVLPQSTVAATSVYDAPPSSKLSPSPRQSVQPVPAQKGRFTVSSTTSATTPAPLSASQPTVNTNRPTSSLLAQSTGATSRRDAAPRGNSAPGGGAPQSPGSVSSSNTNVAPAPKSAGRGRLARSKAAVTTEEARKTERTEVASPSKALKSLSKESLKSEPSPYKKTKTVAESNKSDSKQADQAVAREETEVLARSEAEATVGKRREKEKVKAEEEKISKDEKKKKKKDKKADKKEKEDKTERKEKMSVYKTESSSRKSSKKDKDVDYDDEKEKKKPGSRNRKSSMTFNPPAAEVNREKISSFYTESASPVLKSKKPVVAQKQKVASKAMPMPRLTPQTQQQPPQQQQQTPAALLNNLSEQQKEDLRKRLQQLAGSSRQVPVQQAPQQQQQQAPQQQAPALMQFNWTNI